MYGILDSRTISWIFFKDYTETQPNTVGQMLRRLLGVYKFFVARKLAITPLFQKVWRIFESKLYQHFLIPPAILWAKSCPADLKTDADTLLMWIWNQYHPSPPVHLEATRLIPVTLPLVAELLRKSYPMIDLSIVKKVGKPYLVWVTHINNNGIAVGIYSKRFKNGMRVKKNIILIETERGPK